MDSEDDRQPYEENVHYHGRAIRTLFIIAALIMVLGLFHALAYLQLPTTLSIISIVVLVYAAGITNPSQVWPMYMDTVISTVGLLVFETYSVNIWRSQNYNTTLFILNEMLAVIFLFALFYSTRTLRWFMVKK